ncbi:MAG TPA: hypothetical protein VGM82_18160 [Gemmatimonadaceae bacterium]|jgi:hypothetical protein
MASPLAAQRPPRLEIAVPAAALSEGPAIVSDGLLSDAKTREHLRNGFPARIHYRLELWRKSGVLSGDDRSGTSEWDVLVNYDPSANVYNMVRRSSDDSYRENFGNFTTLTSAEITLAKPYKTSLHPTRSGRYYYNLSVEVQTLAQSDLDATMQWLRGPTAPGKTSNPITVLRSGVGTIFSRLLGGAQNKYEQPSEVFSVP